MKKLLLTATILFISFYSFAQSGFKKNGVYVEAGGNGLFTSLNYERQLTVHPGLAARIGIGFYSESALYLTIPVGMNYLFSLNRKNSFIDAGFGVTLTREDAKLFRKNNYGDHFVNFIPSIGYRRHTSKDLVWRVSLNPVINNYGFVPWAGVMLGKRF